MKMILGVAEFWSCVIKLIQGRNSIVVNPSQSGRFWQKFCHSKIVKTYYAPSHIGRSCQKSSKISESWISTDLTDSAQIWLDQLKIGSKWLGIP